MKISPDTIKAAAVATITAGCTCTRREKIKRRERRLRYLQRRARRTPAKG